MEFLFILAIILLPFDNLFFAPSAGWGAISPIIFFFYAIINKKYLFKTLKKYDKPLFFLIILFIVTVIISIFNGWHVSALLDTIITIVLGISTLFAFEIYFTKNKNPGPVVKILLTTYFISLIIGWIQYITIKFGIGFMYDFFDFISKRNYLAVNRIQYTFTEPSFISMHVFGVLLPIYYVTKNKKLLRLIIAFCLSTIIFNSSVRFLMDVIIIVILLLLYIMIKKKKFIMLFFIILASIGSLLLISNRNLRVKNILTQGVYADPSLATRYFRIQASVYGYKYKPLNFIIGYGMGNSIQPLRLGYDEAFAKYRNSYTSELKLLKNENFYDSSASFCLYTRLLSEFGLIAFIIITKKFIDIFKKSKFEHKYEMLLVFLYLYLQFESYAFYTLWIYIYILVNTSNRKQLKLEGSAK